MALHNRLVVLILDRNGDSFVCPAATLYGGTIE